MYPIRDYSSSTQHYSRKPFDVHVLLTIQEYPYKTLSIRITFMKIIPKCVAAGQDAINSPSSFICKFNEEV